MPVLDHERARDLAETFRRDGRRLVVAYGVYDILHPGHIRYLQAARSEGDALIVAVRSDRTVRAHKGPSRPVTPERERAEIVAALDSVDASVIFDDPTPDAIINRLRPDVLVKGDPRPASEIAAWDPVEAHAGRVVRIPLELGWSTTSILDSIQRKSTP